MTDISNVQKGVVLYSVSEPAKAPGIGNEFILRVFVIKFTPSYLYIKTVEDIKVMSLTAGMFLSVFPSNK